MLNMFHPSIQDYARNITGTAILVITALLLILNEFQKVYLLGLFKNPLYAYHKKIQKSFLLYIVSQFLQVGEWKSLETGIWWSAVYFSVRLLFNIDVALLKIIIVFIWYDCV